jgi:hypothetical protein
MRACLSFTSALVLSSLAVAAQTALPPPLEINDHDAHVDNHRIGPDEVLHRTQQEMDEIDSHRDPHQMGPVGDGICIFRVVVSASGLVESATLKPDPSGMTRCSPHQREAESIIRVRRYTPWLIDGRPQRVLVQDGVYIYPPERLGPQVPFPATVDRTTLKFTLQRTSGIASFPAYTVVISGDGTVNFVGTAHVALTGHHTAHVSSSVVQSLIDRFRAAEFLSALPDYSGGMPDGPAQILTLSINGQTKQVVDYLGLRDGLPWAISELEDAIDQAADSSRWIDYKGDLVTVLNQEKWNYAAATAANQDLYDEAITNANEPLIQAFVSARAPALAAIGNGLPPVCMATRIGRLPLVREMLSGREKIPSAVKNLCLVDAAISGQTEMLDFWLGRGADPMAKLPASFDESNRPELLREQQGLLVNAACSGNAELLEKVLSFKFDVNQEIGIVPLLNLTIGCLNYGSKADEVVDVLLKAGADPNARDGMEETALFKCSYKTELVQPLLHAGAEINARDRDGSTPLIRYARSEPFVRELLAQGADPSLANKRGETALSVANQIGRIGCPACARLIQDALDRQSGVTPKLN